MEKMMKKIIAVLAIVFMCFVTPVLAGHGHGPGDGTGTGDQTQSNGPGDCE